MVGTVFLQKSAQENSFRWVVVDPGKRLSGLMQGSLEEAAAIARNYHVVIILQGTDTILTQVSIPTRNRGRILQAIPFALEDQFVEEIEDMHFAIPAQKRPSEVTPVCAVSRDVLASWMSDLNEFGIEPDVVTSAILCLPYEENQWTVLIEQDLVTIRTGMYSGISLKSNDIPGILSLTLTQKNILKPSSIQIIDTSGPAAENATGYLPDELEDVEVKVIPYPGQALELLSSSFQANQVINLLQGEFRVQKQRTYIPKKWYPAAAMLLVFVLLGLITVLTDYIQLSAKASSQKAQIEKLFHQAMPDVRKIVNPQAQMEQRLKELQNQTGGGAGFLEILANSGKIFQQTANLQLTGIHYRDGALDVELTISDLQSLEVLKQQLSAAGLSTEIRSATASGKEVQGRIQLKGSL